jgi:hypothetical protein
VFADLGRLMTPWLSGGTSISELLIDPLIDPLLSAMDTIFEVVKLVIDALGTSVQRASSGIRRTSQLPSREATGVLR